MSHETSQGAEDYTYSYVGELRAFARLVGRRFANDQCMKVSAQLSYTALLSVVPLGAIAFSVLKAFPVFDDMQDKIKSVVFENFLPDSIANVQGYLEGFVGHAGNLTAIGIVALAVTALMLLATIEGALNDIFRVKTQRPFVPRMLMFWAVLTLGPMLLGASLSIGTYLFTLTEVLGVETLGGFSGVMARLLPMVLAMFAFTVFYAIVPNRPVRLKHALIGGAVAGVLFAFVRLAFAWYVTAFPAYQTIYGAVSIIPIFLIWMYLTWAVVLIGAEVAAAMPEWGQASVAEAYVALTPAKQLQAAIGALERLWRDSQGGAREHMARPANMNEDLMAEALDGLRQAGIVGLSAEGKWMLARDLDTVTIVDIAGGLGLIPNPADLAPGGPQWRGRLKTALETALDTASNRSLKQFFEGE